MPDVVSKGESAVQDAIVVALAEYCYSERLRFRHTLPYANQQGFEPNKICADMVAILANSVLLVFEIKAALKFPPNAALASFKKDQREEYLFLEEELNVPVHYAFNTVQTLAHALPGPFSAMMCAQTLTEIGLALPSLLTDAGKVKQISYTLFEYLRKSLQLRNQSGVTTPTAPNMIERLALIMNTSLTNSIMVLAIAPDSSILSLDATALSDLKNDLDNISENIDKNKYPVLAEYISAVKRVNKLKAEAKARAEAKAIENAEAVKRKRLIDELIDTESEKSRASEPNDSVSKKLSKRRGEHESFKKLGSTALAEKDSQSATPKKKN
ncbi:hypothetical protein [Massilia sp. 9096]|uniref:hypothetical protein n=1 Tax=Massilia sp. 9096 TaxID=1500894 RepID=UPI0012E03CFC|nr:hypothetical protein [Massilia sp. 9096]